MTNDTPCRYRWEEMESDHPMRGVTRERVVGEKAMVSRIRLDAGCIVPPHEHANEQIACVLSGRVRFTIGDGDSSTETLGPGEVLAIPANVRHGAEAIEACEILDVFAPPSEATGVDQAIA